MDYLNFVQEQAEDKGLTLFEKVLVASARAKDLLEERQVPEKALKQHKPISIAIYELNQNILKPIVQKKSENELFYQESFEENPKNESE